MAEQRSLAVRQHSRKPSPLLTQFGISNGIDLSVHEPKAPALKASVNPPLGKTQGEQLPLRHDPMLPLSKRSDLPPSPNPIALPLGACLTWTTHTGG